MGHKDYTKFSEKSEEIVKPVLNEKTNVNEEEITTEKAKELGQEIVNAIQTGIDNVDTTEKSDDDIKEAIVSNCKALNVRKTPDKNSEVVCVVAKDTELTVDVSKSTEDFYKVYTVVKDVLMEGYCVKEFITIK